MSVHIKRATRESAEKSAKNRAKESVNVNIKCYCDCYYDCDCNCDCACVRERAGDCQYLQEGRGSRCVKCYVYVC